MESLVPIGTTVQTPRRSLWLRYLRYFLVGGMANLGLWTAALSYLKVTPPTYTSKWSLILPGASQGVNINLPDIGTATSSSSTPFGNSSMDPRANYQFIFTDESFLESIAIKLKITADELGKPQVKLLDNTSIMNFEVEGPSPETARERSHAIYSEFIARLNLLRAEEILKKEEGSQATLKSAQEKLQIAQSKLSSYKGKSGLSSSEQVQQLASNIEQLRRQNAESFVSREESRTRFAQLSKDLGLSVTDVTNAFTLHADQQFQSLSKDFNESSATLEILLDKWGEKHPLVVKEISRKDAAQAALLKRAVALLNQEVTLAYLSRLGIRESGSGRESLFQILVSTQAEQTGASEEYRAYGEQISQLESRLKILVQKQATLDSLTREVQIAETVFSSTLAKLDLGKSDIFSSYPLTQIIAEPSLANKKSSPKDKFVLFGTLVGSIFISTGLFVLWWRIEIKKYVKGKLTASQRSAQ